MADTAGTGRKDCADQRVGGPELVDHRVHDNQRNQPHLDVRVGQGVPRVVQPVDQHEAGYQIQEQELLPFKTGAYDSTQRPELQDEENESHGASNLRRYAAAAAAAASATAAASCLSDTPRVGAEFVHRKRESLQA